MVEKGIPTKCSQFWCSWIVARRRRRVRYQIKKQWEWMQGLPRFVWGLEAITLTTPWLWRVVSSIRGQLQRSELGYLCAAYYFVHRLTHAPRMLPEPCNTRIDVGLPGMLWAACRYNNRTAYRDGIGFVCIVPRKRCVEF